MEKIMFSGVGMSIVIIIFIAIVFFAIVILMLFVLQVIEDGTWFVRYGIFKKGQSKENPIRYSQTPIELFGIDEIMPDGRTVRISGKKYFLEIKKWIELYVTFPKKVVRSLKIGEIYSDSQIAELNN